MTFADAWKSLIPHFGILILSSFVLGLVFVLGVMVFVIPAFYFMSLYLFVPHWIMTERGLSLSAYLYRSTKTAKRAFWKCVFTVVIAMVLGIGTYLLAQTLGPWAGGFVDNEVLRHLISLTINIALSVVSATLIDTWVALLYLDLKEV